jgi:hypothetical protein
MFKQAALSSNLRLCSTAGTWGEAQIVAVAARNVVLDLQTRNYDTTGVLHRQHALANLPLSAAVRLRDLLDEAIQTALDTSADAQPGLWSDATVRDIAARCGRRPA